MFKLSKTPTPKWIRQLIRCKNKIYFCCLFVAVCKSAPKFSIYVICSIKFWKFSYQSDFAAEVSLKITLSMHRRNRNYFTILNLVLNIWAIPTNEIRMSYLFYHSVYWIHCTHFKYSFIRTISRTLSKWIFG